MEFSINIFSELDEKEYVFEAVLNYIDKLADIFSNPPKFENIKTIEATIVELVETLEFYIGYQLRNAVPHETSDFLYIQRGYYIDNIKKLTNAKNKQSRRN